MVGSIGGGGGAGPATQPAGQAASQPASQPARQLAGRQAGQPASQPAGWPASKSATQPSTYSYAHTCTHTTDLVVNWSRKWSPWHPKGRKTEPQKRKQQTKTPFPFWGCSFVCWLLCATWAPGGGFRMPFEFKNDPGWKVDLLDTQHEDFCRWCDL